MVRVESPSRILKFTPARALRVALLGTTALAAATSFASADAFDIFPLPPGAPTGNNISTSLAGNAISGNGRVFLGSTTGGSYQRYWSWADGVFRFYTTPTGGVANPMAVNFDGSVVVGAGNPSNLNHALMWTNNGQTVVDLQYGAAFDPGGSLAGYTKTTATGISYDGKVVTGTGTGNTFQAYRWTQPIGMVGIGFLQGDNFSSASGVSGDGKVIFGRSGAQTNFSITRYQAFAWSQAGGMIGLGYLPGYSWSTATAANYDGSVIAGTAKNANASEQAFRWTQATGMVSLGVLAGYPDSNVAAMSTDGKIIIGAASVGSNYTAYRWTEGGGMKSLASLLTAGGVNIGNFNLRSAIGISADGKIIVGRAQIGTYGINQIYVARCESSYCPGMVSVQDFMTSFAGQSAVGQTTNAAVNGGLGTMQEYATQAKQSQAGRHTPYSVFGYGAYDSDPVGSGGMGITRDLAGDIVVGGNLNASTITTDLVFNGNSKLTGGGGGAFVARTPDSGLQWFAGANALAMSGDITRGYLNGVANATSKGSTSALGYGATARVGWTFVPASAVRVTPFASYTITRTHFDAYAEIDGPMPAAFTAYDSTVQTSRVGADARYTFTPGGWIWGTIAWAHRLDSGRTPDIAGALLGTMDFTVSGFSVAKDWAEVGGGVRLPAWTNGAVTASVTASLTPNQTTTYVSRLGVSQAF